MTAVALVRGFLVLIAIGGCAGNVRVHPGPALAAVRVAGPKCGARVALMWRRSWCSSGCHRDLSHLLAAPSLTRRPRPSQRFRGRLRPRAG